MSYSRENNLISQQQGGKAFSLMIAIYVLLSFVVQGILLSFTSQNSFVYIAVCSCLSSLAILFAIASQTKFQKCTYNALNIKKFKIKAVLPAVLIGTGMFLGLGFVNIALIQGLNNLGINISSPNVVLGNIWQFLFFTITLAFLPAIFEELFFRGLFLTSLNGQSIISKTLMVGLFFALYHMNLGQFIYQFIYGSALCLLTIYAGSIFPSIITHFLNNFAVLIFTYLKIQIDLFSPLLIVFGLICLSLFFIFVISGLKKDKDTRQNQSEKLGVKAVFFPYGILGVLVCAITLISATLL